MEEKMKQVLYKWLEIDLLILLKKWDCQTKVAM